MIVEYITAALHHARYEIIEDDEPYYGEVPELPGVWATGTSLRRAGNVWPRSSTTGS